MMPCGFFASAAEHKVASGVKRFREIAHGPQVLCYSKDSFLLTGSQRRANANTLPGEALSVCAVDIVDALGHGAGGLHEHQDVLWAKRCRRYRASEPEPAGHSWRGRPGKRAQRAVCGVRCASCGVRAPGSATTLGGARAQALASVEMVVVE